MIRWVRRSVLFLLVAAALFQFGKWRETMLSTNFYGGPALAYHAEFWDYLALHPESLLPLNWGRQPLFLPPIIFLGLILAVLQGGPFLGRRWKNRLRGWRPVDAPWLYLIVIIPILLLSLAIVGVGAQKNWYAMEIVVDGKTVMVPNPAYSHVAHTCANLIIGLPGLIFNFGFSMKQKLLVVFLVLLLFALFWETKENRDIQESLRRTGHQDLAYQNPPEDSEFDIAATLDAMGIAGGIYGACWFACASPEQVMEKKFGSAFLSSKAWREMKKRF
jgi:hypothetical protein